jgi:ligand-binding sensor domain-containing protein/signal transduction histidine kinase
MPSRRRVIPLRAVQVLWCVAGVALASTNAILPYSVRIWQTDDGLPQNSVYDIVQTRDGYLWVGTREGLARFDGVRFTVVDEPAAPELKHGWITALCTGQDGSLWVGLESGGVTRLKDGVFSHFTEADGLASSHIHCFFEAKDGTMWIGSRGGLNRYRGGQLTGITQQQGLSDNFVQGISEDARGSLQVATRRGLDTLSKEGAITSVVSFGTNWAANSLKEVYTDRQGNLWIGSADGLSRVSGTETLFYGLADGLPDRVVNVVFQDHSGQVWVGTYGGLARLVNGKVVPRSERESVFGDLVYTIFEDREDNLWVGARDGLYRLNPARFTTYTTSEGLTRNNVMSVCEDRAGTVWLGIWDGGLNSLRAGRVKAYNSPVELARDSVLSLHEGRASGPASLRTNRENGVRGDARPAGSQGFTLWIGMDLNAGLTRFRNGEREQVAQPPGFLSGAIRVIAESPDGALWIGTTSGLNVVRDDSCAAYTTTNGLAGDDVLAILPDAQGRFWIGTDGGLNHWSDGKFATFRTQDGLSDNAVDALYQDPEHTLWIGTRGGGLNRYHQGKFTAYTTKQGLFSDEVYEILEDDFGYFWMSCRRGIFRVARKDLDDLDSGRLKSVTCTAFGTADGLVSVQCNGVAKPAGWKARDGRLWFPTIHGVVAVETRIKTNAKPPPVVIEEVIADRKAVQSPKSKVQSPESQVSSSESLPQAQAAVFSSSAFGAEPLEIAPGRGELEIHYTALSFQAPEKNLFKYMLEGADTDWSEPVTQRTAHYHNLRPGNYRFFVKACNNDGIWNETGAVVALVLRPHFWQAWWFRAAVPAAVALFLTLLYRFRVEQLRELERLRVDIAANLHDDVGARLTKVAMMTELVDHETPAANRAKPKIQAISRTTREVIQAMDEVVWTINPKNDSLENLANYIFQYSQEYFQSTGVRCRLDMPPELPNRSLSTEARHNLFMAVKESLNNVLKHASATEVRITLAVAEKKLALTVADNGCGFVPDQTRAAGDGLRNMRDRLEQIGGRLVLESAPGKGTVVRLEAGTN